MGKGNAHSLRVGLQTAAAPMETSVENPQKAKSKPHVCLLDMGTQDQTQVLMFAQNPTILTELSPQLHN